MMFVSNQIVMRRRWISVTGRPSLQSDHLEHTAVSTDLKAQKAVRQMVGETGCVLGLD